MMVEGESIDSPELGHYDIAGGDYSTDDRETPGWKTKASSVFNLSWGQDDCRKLCRVFWRCALFLLFPQLSLYERDMGSSPDISFGSVSRLGNVCSRGPIDFAVTDKVKGEVNLDYYGRRGWAGGAALSYITPGKNSDHPPHRGGITGLVHQRSRLSN